VVLDSDETGRLVRALRQRPAARGAPAGVSHLAEARLRGAGP
jgi:hypothetical protein